MTGSRYIKYPRTSEDNRLAVGLSTPLASYTFNAGAQNTGLFRHQFTTMTMTQGGGFVLCNANSTATTATGASLQSWQYFPLMGNGALVVSSTIQITAAPLTNQVFECGLFIGTNGTTAPTEGVYFRFTTSGLIGVLNYNGTETTTSTLLAAGTFTANQNYDMTIIVHGRVVEFWREGIFLGEIATPAGNGQPFLTTALPFCFQQRNSGAVSGSPQMQVKVGDVHVNQEDCNLGLPFPHLTSMMGQHGSQGQDGGTMGSTALYTNSLAPGAGAAISNTAAAAGFTGLGGQHAVLPTLTANTDGILSSFQNPAGSTTQTPRTLVITGVRIQGIVTTVLAGGPVYYFYSLAYGHTAVSLATADTGSFVTATTKSPRRIPLGIETYGAAAAVGTLGSSGIYVPFNSPIVINPGEFVAIAAKNVGTVTTTGVITVLVTYDSYWR